MSLNRYSFEVIDTKGCCGPVAEILASDMTAVFERVTAISEGIEQPGYRIRVKDENGNAVFVGMTTRQRDEDRGSLAA